MQYPAKLSFFQGKTGCVSNCSALWDSNPVGLFLNWIPLRPIRFFETHPKNILKTNDNVFGEK
jgi:hypothetical protein